MAKIVIDGREYELSLDFDIGEARVIKRFAGITLQELEGHDPSDPDLIAAFLFIVFRRENSTLSDAVLEERVNKVKLAAIDMREDEEVVTVPPARAPSGNGANATSSGSSFDNGADPFLESVNPATTGAHS